MFTGNIFSPGSSLISLFIMSAISEVLGQQNKEYLQHFTS